MPTEKTIGTVEVASLDRFDSPPNGIRLHVPALDVARFAQAPSQASEADGIGFR
jgi:hypothetical protein